MPFHQHTLPNGLTIIGETSPSARSAAVGFFVRTGSRDETPEVSGVTHFLEHMVFKGTPHRTYLDVNPNVAVGAAGRFDWPAWVALAEKHCGGWSSGPVGRDCLRESGGSGGFKVLTKDKVTQEHVILMSGGPPADSPQRHSADLLSM